MGEWSDYFEDFPEENPANYVGDRFDPRAAAQLRAQEATVAMEQASLNLEIAQIVARHRAAKELNEVSAPSAGAGGPFPGN